jgi:hypothetical protein
MDLKIGEMVEHIEDKDIRMGRVHSPNRLSGKSKLS